MWVVHEKTFIPHLPRDIWIIRLFCSWNLHWRRDVLINPFNKLDYFLHVFDPLTLLYILILASVHSTNHLFFIIYQVSYSSLVWDVHPLPPPKEVSIKNMIFTSADIRNGKSTIFNDSNICTSIASKSQDRANYVMVSFRQHHFDGKGNTDSQIQN